MSSVNASSLSILLYSIQVKFSIIIGSLLIVFGITGCFLNILLFSRRQFRLVSCCTYFLFASVSMLISVSITSVTIVYSVYNPSLINSISFYCKLWNYIQQSSSMTYRWMLAGASLDRYARSSGNARLRSFATIDIARRITIAISIFWLIFPIPLLILFDIKGGLCLIKYGYSAVLYNSIAVLINGCFIPISIMIICTLLIRRNLAEKRERRRFIIGSEQRRDKREDLQEKLDQQAFLLLFGQIIVYILLTIPWMIYTIYNTISFTIINKSADRISIEQTVLSLTGMTNVLFPASSFYLYTLTSALFRKQLIFIFRSFILCKCFVTNNQIQAITINHQQANNNH